MARIARKSDGRRIFTDEFKREQIDRVTSGELTLAELSRKLGIARSLLQRWKRRMLVGVASAGPWRGTSASEPREAQYVRELQLLVGKQAVELEFLRAEVSALRRGRRSGRASRK